MTFAVVPFFVNDQNASRNSCAIKQIRRQANNRFNIPLFYNSLADNLLHPAAKQYTMRHDGRHFSIWLQAGDHVLHKHQVGFLACLRREAEVETLLVLHPSLSVILREWWIGDHAVEQLHVIILYKHRGFKCVIILDMRVGNVVQDHVHLTDGPHCTIQFLTINRQPIRSLSQLFYKLPRLNQHAARTTGRVVHRHAFFGRDHVHQQTHNT